MFFVIKRSPNFSEGSGFNLFSEEMAKIGHVKSNEEMKYKPRKWAFNRSYLTGQALNLST